MIWRIIALSAVLSAMALAQTDAEKFAEGRIALDQHQDCPAAESAFRSVSEASHNAIWAFYMGKTMECLKRPADALVYYEQYDQLIPGQAEIINKIGELRYQVRKQQEEQTQRQNEAKSYPLKPLMTWFATIPPQDPPSTLIQRGAILIIKNYLCEYSIDVRLLDPSTVKANSIEQSFWLEAQTTDRLDLGEIQCAQGPKFFSNSLNISASTLQEASSGIAPLRESIQRGFVGYGPAEAIINHYREARAVARAEAVQRLAETMGKLTELMTGKLDYKSEGATFHEDYRVIAARDCKISYTSGTWVGRDKPRYTDFEISLTGLKPTQLVTMDQNNPTTYTLLASNFESSRSLGGLSFSNKERAYQALSLLQEAALACTP